MVTMWLFENILPFMLGGTDKLCLSVPPMLLENICINFQKSKVLQKMMLSNILPDSIFQKNFNILNSYNFRP